MGSTGAGEGSAATESEAGTWVGIGDTEAVVFAWDAWWQAAAGGFFPSQPALGGGVGEGQKGGRRREERDEENGEHLAGQGCT